MKYIVIILTTFLFSGCVPTIYNTYYKPSYDDNSTQTVAAYCHGYAGPPSGISFEIPNGIKVNVKTRKQYNKDDYGFKIAFKIPSNTNIQFLSDELTIIFPNGSKETQQKKMGVSTLLRSQPLSAYQFGNFCPHVEAQEIDQKVLSNVNVGFSISEKKNVKEHPDVIQLQLPLITLNNRVKEIPSITMRSFSSGSFFYYLTEEFQNKRLKRYNECLKINSKKICKYGLTTANNSFEYITNDFHLTGRVVWNKQEGVNQFYVHTNVKALTNMTWQFNTNTVQIVDINNSLKYSTEINPMTIYCTNENITPLNALIQSMKDEVKLDVEGTIGEEKPKYIDILLPSMMINGKVFHFKPIRLELHLFDFGVDPFNC